VVSAASNPVRKSSTFDAMRLSSKTDQSGGRRIELDLHHAGLAPVAHALQSSTLELSAPVNITLQMAARALAGIPTEATAYAFAYPARIDWAKLGDSAGFDTYRDAELTQGAVSVVLCGAFVYFDSQGGVCAINAVSEFFEADAMHPEHAPEAEQMLQFSAPMPLPESVIAALGSRLQPVTLAALLSRGAEVFAWMLPGEALPGLQSPPKSGGFAYVFNEESVGVEGSLPFAGKRGVYFPIAS